VTIRSLVEHGYVSVNDKLPGPENVSIVFAFDSGYLEHFKVTLASLAYSGNFIDAPIVIYTDDSGVAEDKIVQLCGDKIIIIPEQKKELLYKLARDHVKRPERADWNRGTFLKWMIFEKQETSSAIFLDVDMIFLNKFDNDIILNAKTAFNAVPQFRPALVAGEDGQKFSVENIYKNFNTIIEGGYSGRMTKNVNSGVMVIKDDMLSDGFFAEITKFAQFGRSVNEQTIFSKYFEVHPELLTMLSAKFNFQQSYLRRLEVEADKSLHILKKVKVLHFAGKPKPWVSTPDLSSQGTSLSMALWHWHRTMADKLLSVKC